MKLFIMNVKSDKSLWHFAEESFMGFAQKGIFNA